MSVRGVANNTPLQTGMVSGDMRTLNAAIRRKNTSEKGTIVHNARKSVPAELNVGNIFELFTARRHGHAL
jgi:hypothetical protein